MNNIIKKLNDDVIKLIQAGEVIEAPFSVVKELVENSLDSGADNIVIEIKNGGKTYIRVTDNGSGIANKYVEFAFIKHSTSKITTVEDFFNIETNGFRGEALPSISAVSNISMTTKTSYENFGTKLTIENDKIIEKIKVGAKNGTTVLVKDLFKHIPARKHFLKSDRSETSKITDLVTRYAISNPSIKIKYINNGKTIFSTFATGKLKDVISIIFQEDFTNKIIQINEFINPNFKITGILGNNSAMYSSRRMEYLFVNKRIIKDELIIKHIENAYRNYIPSGNFPMFFLNLTVNPKEIDINIHPNKLKIKFTNETTIFSELENTIRNKLNKELMVPAIKIENSNEKNKSILNEVLENYANSKNLNNYNTIIKKENLKTDNFIDVQRDNNNNLILKTNNLTNIEKEKEKEEIQENNDDFLLKIPKEILKNEFSFPEDENLKFVDLTLLKYKGRFFDTYILLEGKNDIFIIDQHAAHERVLYEKFLKDFFNKKIYMQNLAIPEKIPIPINLIEYSKNIIEHLKDFGFELDLFGDNILLLRAIPAYLDSSSANIFINSVFDTYLNVNLENDVIKNKLATKACKAAIKGNDTRISDIEVENLINDLEHCENKFACPHGRPTIVRINKYEIEKIFKRIL